MLSSLLGSLSCISVRSERSENLKERGAVEMEEREPEGERSFDENRSKVKRKAVKSRRKEETGDKEETGVMRQEIGDRTQRGGRR